MLSVILTMVGTMGEMGKGIFLLSLYSLGFSLPMLAVAYSSHILQQRLKTAVAGNQWIFRYVMGGILILYGFYALFVGNLALT
jgi:cytochrome c-type biogenesis protein